MSLPKWAENRDPLNLWMCEGCESVYSTDRGSFHTTGWTSEYNHKKQEWLPKRSTLCGYCHDLHQRYKNAG